jgi:hypothetical protein
MPAAHQKWHPPASLLQEQFGVEHAAAFMKDNFIHLDVAMRVLLRPGERRRHHA